jgi:hypothetical protein
LSAGATADAALWGADFTLAALYLRGHWGGPQPWWYWYTTLLTVIGLVFSLAAGDWAGAGFCVATLALLARDWWNRRGRKAAKAVGDKSRAVLAAIVVRAREAGTPVPEGVRACLGRLP